MKTSLVVLALLTGFAWTPSAHAQSCSLGSGSGRLVDFGTYSAMNGDMDATGTLTVNCVPAAPLNLPVAYSIAIGTGGANSFNPRKLSSGGSTLRYNLYADAAHLLIWGDASAGTVKLSGACSGGCSVPVYGRLFGSQVVPAQTYSDQVTVTLEF